MKKIQGEREREGGREKKINRADRAGPRPPHLTQWRFPVHTPHSRPDGRRAPTDAARSVATTRRLAIAMWRARLFFLVWGAGQGLLEALLGPPPDGRSARHPPRAPSSVCFGLRLSGMASSDAENDVALPSVARWSALSPAASESRPRRPRARRPEARTSVVAKVVAIYRAPRPLGPRPLGTAGRVVRDTRPGAA